MIQISILLPFWRRRCLVGGGVNIFFVFLVRGSPADLPGLQDTINTASMETCLAKKCKAQVFARQRSNTETIYSLSFPLCVSWASCLEPLNLTQHPNFSILKPKKGRSVSTVHHRMEKVQRNFTTTGRILFHNSRKKIADALFRISSMHNSFQFTQTWVRLPAHRACHAAQVSVFVLLYR